MNTNLEKQLAVEKERADYAWKNTCSIDAARQKEMSMRDAAEHEVAVLREALEPFADISFYNSLPDGAGFASRRNGAHVSYGDIRRARELLRSNAKVKGSRE